jgi:two-component system, cell cycle sensor histidine kinase and response regulator CckA
MPPSEPYLPTELSASWLRSALAATDLAAWEWDARTGDLRWSRDLQHLTSLSGSGEGDPGRTHIHPDDRPELLAALERSLRSDRDLLVEFRVIRPDGTLSWKEARGRPKTGSDGTPVGVTGIAQDVTALREAEVRARAYERFAGFVDSDREAFFALDGEWRFTHLNRAASEALARSPDELVGKVIWEEFPWVVGSGFRRLYEEALGSGGAVESEEYFEPADAWYEVHARPASDGLAVLFRDITVRKKAELALRESEARFRRLVDYAADPIFVHDLEGRILLVNEAACQHLGYTREELLERVRLVDIDPMCTPEYLRELWPELLRERAITALSVNRRKDGVSYPAEIHVGILDDDPGHPQIVGIARDITSRRETEQALERSERHFRSLIENARDMITVVDPEGDVRYASPSHERILGYPPALLVGRNIREIVHPDDLEKTLRGIESLFVEPGSVLRREIRLRHAEGHWVVIEVAGSSLPGDDQGGLVVNSRDVTDRRLAEEALRASEERYRRFFQEDLTADFITDPSGNILDCNEAFARVFGFRSVEDALRSNAVELWPRAKDRTAFVELVRQNNKLENATLELRRMDGTPVHAVVNTIGEMGEDGELLSLRGYLFDITQQKLLEEQLRHSQKLEAVGQLAGGIAHDFNNLMTAILGHAELLLLDAEGGLREDLEEIRAAANRAAALTRQLLAFSRRQALQPRVLQLNATIRDTEGMLRRLVGVDIDFDIDLSAASGSVRADPNQIEQVLVNLVVNARDAMPSGGRITIRTEDRVLDETDRSRYAFLRTGPYVMLEVSDTGEGMNEAIRARVFEPFFTTKEQGKGTGLGLATVYGIVKQSGGFVLAEGEPGEGARFTIYLPRVAEAVAGSAAEEVIAHGAEGMNGAETILVVEDEEAVREVIRRALEIRGFRVLVAGDGEEALRLGEGALDRVDLLLTDLRMPRLGGEALARALRARHHGLSVLFMSGYAGDLESLAVRSAAPGAFLQKPFSPEDLVLAVRQVLDG